MPRDQLLEFILRAGNKNWFPRCERVNASGQIGTLLDLLILGALRYLGHGWTFDDLEEATRVSEEVPKCFFHKCFEACTDKRFLEYVKYPKTEAEIQDSIAEFTEAGFTGCIGSTDCTHVVVGTIRMLFDLINNSSCRKRIPQLLV
jgi:hypothetical protein